MKKFYALASALLMLTSAATAQHLRVTERTAVNTQFSPLQIDQPIELTAPAGAAAKAKKHPIEDQPDGTLYTYSLKTYYYNGQMDEWINREGQKTMVVINDDEVYIKNFINNFLYNTWIKGYMSADRKKVVFDNMQPYTEDGNGYAYFVSLAYVNKNSDVLADMESDEFELAFDEVTGTLSNPDLEFCLCNEDGGVFSYNEGYVLTLFTDELVQVPEGLTTQPYSLAYESSYAYNYPMMVYVSRDGNDFYFKGFSEKTPDSWVKGTLDGDTIKIMNNQYVGLYDDLYFLYMRGAAYSGMDQQGYPMYKSKQYAALKYDETDGSMYGPDGIIFVLGTGHGGYSQSIPSQTMHPFYNVPAKPANPSIRYFDIDTQYHQVPCNMAFVVPVADTEGNYINPDSLFFQVFVDGEPWHFDPKFYAHFADEWIVNCRFSDRGKAMNRTDFSGSYHVLSFDKDLRPKTLGLQSIYFMEGTVNYSSIVTYDIATKQAIDAVIAEPASQEAGAVVYDLRGRRLQSMPASGLVVRNGKVVVIK